MRSVKHILTGQRSSTSSSATSATAPLGFEILSEGAPPINADIIFVHGLRGHRRDAWTKDGICWPKDLLPKEEALSNVRILTFGYDSNVVSFGGNPSQNSLFKHTISLVNGLCQQRSDDTNRQIIFVAHSLGGLIVKDALHYSDSHRTTQPDLTTILDATRGIIFLGTPHRGSGATTLPKIVASVIRAVQDVNVDLIRDLERDSQTLDRIGVDFGQILSRRTFKVFSFEEELAMGGRQVWRRGRKVVDGGSAIIGDPYEWRDTIHANHMDMVKFSKPTDEGYGKVLYVIKILLEQTGLSDEATRRSYASKGRHALGQGNLLRELDPYCSHSAAFDSAARFDPPQCTESTRRQIMKEIEEWIKPDGDNNKPSLFWLHGGAGVGKSAVAQSISETFKKRKQLAASFFFDRSEASRNNRNNLIPTLVWHLVDAFHGFAPFVEESIRRNPAFFTKRLETQIQELLTEPLRDLKLKWPLIPQPRLIVIDGLDECQDPDFQCELLRVIAIAIPNLPYPLRFFITSRSESHITKFFNHHHELQAITVKRYNLSDDLHAEADIRKFLEQEFAQVRLVHHLGPQLRDWPHQNAITSLVDRSSGHFIYPSTVIKYIQSPEHEPDVRLEVILGHREPEAGDQPYAQLDALYAFIFGLVEQSRLENICIVLGILYLQSKGAGFFGWGSSVLEEFFSMRAGGLLLLLDPIFSLVAVDGVKVKVLHKFLFDYLLDASRRGQLPFDPVRVYEKAICYVMERKIVKDLRERNESGNFSYACQVDEDLHSLIPNPRMIKPGIVLPWYHILHEYWRPIIWDFFGTPNREDFSSTLARWIDYIHSVPLGRIQTQSRVTTARVDGLTHRLDILLKKWKPSNYIPKDIRTVSTDPVGLSVFTFTQQEHNAFSALVEASFFGDPETIASSLIFGDHFIHSYNLKISDEGSFLLLRTYSRYDKLCCQHLCCGKNVDIEEETRSYLQNVDSILQATSSKSPD